MRYLRFLKSLDHDVCIYWSLVAFMFGVTIFGVVARAVNGPGAFWIDPARPVILAKG